MALKLKVKKTLLKRKVDGATLSGYYGRVITSGKKSFADIVADAGRNTTMHKAELKMAGDLLLDSIAEGIKSGYIIDLGPLGTLYPAVSGTWKQNPDDLSLSELKPKVNYKPSDDIAGAVRGASLAWTTEEATKDNTVDEDTDQTPGGAGSGSSSADDPGNEGD
ncbi:MAG: hypothetical protein IJ551_09310 [Prevotella sp.]|nr:hypothetical protein [Prevotella sp.]